ncbi:MAG: DUF748 domain-containing protein [Pseudomonadota bacterium]
MTRSNRRWAVALGLAAVALAAVALAFQLALRRLHSGIEAALGPRATLQATSLGWTGVELRGLRVRAQPGRWPAAQELSAERVRVVPSLSSLWRSGWRIASVTVEGASLSLLRDKDGRLRVLPSLLEGAGDDKAQPGARQRLHIGALHLRDVAIDFHDASVVGARGAPHHIRLEALRADVGPLALPALDERAALELQATLKGPQRNGSLSLQGQLTPATRDADLTLKVKGLDLVSLQPYLLRNNEASVRRGSLDLALAGRVKGQRLDAPGRLTLTDLELAGGGGVFATFAGVPRQAVLAAMSRDGRIELAFTLEGRLDDPKFSLNEVFAARFAVGLAEKLGVSLGGMVEGVGSVIKGLFGR